MLSICSFLYALCHFLPEIACDLNDKLNKTNDKLTFSLNDLQNVLGTTKFRWIMRCHFIIQKQHKQIGRTLDSTVVWKSKVSTFAHTAEASTRNNNIAMSTNKAAARLCESERFNACVRVIDITGNGPFVLVSANQSALWTSTFDYIEWSSFMRQPHFVCSKRHLLERY